MIIVALSDTHGNVNAIKKIMPVLKNADLTVHLGDHFYDVDFLKGTLKTDPVTVYGNCDGGGDDLVLNLENTVVLLTHGDKYGVKSSLTRLYLRAKELGAKLVLYGHTHQPKIENFDGITFVNGGCMTAFCETPTYAKIEINDGIIDAKIIKA